MAKCSAGPIDAGLFVAGGAVAGATECVIVGRSADLAQRPLAGMARNARRGGGNACTIFVIERRACERDADVGDDGSVATHTLARSHISSAMDKLILERARRQ